MPGSIDILDDMSTKDKRIEELTDALRWLAEMSGYAVSNLEPEWARKNRSDLQSAIDQANSTLST